MIYKLFSYETLGTVKGFQTSLWSPA